jgi:choline kinase
VSAVGYERLPTLSPYLGPRTRSQLTAPCRRASTRSTRARHALSDTDYLDGDVIVPSCNVILDNPRTLGYPRGPVTPEFNLFAIRKRTERAQGLDKLQKPNTSAGSHSSLKGMEENFS